MSIDKYYRVYNNGTNVDNGFVEVAYTAREFYDRLTVHDLNGLIRDSISEELGKVTDTIYGVDQYYPLNKPIPANEEKADLLEEILRAIVSVISKQFDNDFSARKLKRFSGSRFAEFTPILEASLIKSLNYVGMFSYDDKPMHIVSTTVGQVHVNFLKKKFPELFNTTIFNDSKYFKNYIS